MHRLAEIAREGGDGEEGDGGDGEDQMRGVVGDGWVGLAEV